MCHPTTRRLKRARHYDRCVREEKSLGKFVNCESLMACDDLARVIRAPDSARRFSQEQKDPNLDPNAYAFDFALFLLSRHEQKSSGVEIG